MGCRSRRIARSNMSILRGVPTTRCAQAALVACAPPSRPGDGDGGRRRSAPRPSGVAARTARGGRSSACALGRRCDPAAGRARRIDRVPYARLRGRIPENGAPAPRSGAPSASLPALTLSTYGLRRAPSIHPVLATTHHAPIYEIGSGMRPYTLRYPLPDATKRYLQGE